MGGIVDIVVTAFQFVGDYITEYLKNGQQGIALFFTFKNLLAVFGGVTIGIFGGAIPGITITMSVALVMPFTFHMEPLTALSLLLGVYPGKAGKSR